MLSHKGWGSFVSMATNTKPIVIKSSKDVFVDRDFPASAVGFELAKLAAHLVEAGVISQESYSNDTELAVLAMNFAADCEEVIMLFQMERDFALKLSGKIEVPTRVTGNGLAWLAGTLVKAKLITAADVGGHLRKLAEKALAFLVACDGAAKKRNLYAAVDYERKFRPSEVEKGFRGAKLVPLQAVLGAAGLGNSTLIAEYKAEGSGKEWTALPPDLKHKEMFRHLAGLEVVADWVKLNPDNGLAEPWKGKVRLADDSRFEFMLANGVPFDLIPQIVTILKAAKIEKERRQKRQAAKVTVEAKKAKKFKKDADHA